MNESAKKELTLYIIITVILVLVSFLNNKFWKLGKQENYNTNVQTNNTYLESGNIIYDVPYEEQWLD